MRKLYIAVSFALCLAAGAMPAQASRIAAEVQTPVVTDTVSQIGVSSWQYSFTITNMGWWSSLNPELSDSVRLIDYQLPYFSDAGVTAINAPAGWAWQIDPTDAFGLGNGAQTLRWYATSVAYGIAGSSSEFFNGVPGDTLGGFSFVGAFAPVKAPFIAGFVEPAFQQQGDPALPGSPDALASGLTTFLPVAGVPESEIYAMMLAGLGLLGFMARRRKQKAA
jgi:hypothetical protein